jgi:predicted GH43/DUF377 family glycosyl hydrolase
MEIPMINYTKRFVAGPEQGCTWADKMILNPAIIKDPENSKTLHMLFRATGACPEKQLEGKPLPYPIFLGYAVSHDEGGNWNFDFAHPALAPAVKYDKREIFGLNVNGQKAVNYANGCIEDPRLFYFENEIYLSVACRAFPPGPYWEHDSPTQCMPEWAVLGKHDLGSAVTGNSTVSLLYKVDIQKLASGNYDQAFSYIAPLHPPDISDDRDVVLFPRKLKIDGKEKIICLHRPKHPWNYEVGRELTQPSIFIAAADKLEDLSTEQAERHILAVPEYEWEQNRIGASWAPIELAPGQWLLPYHGKQDDKVGYTQSFMILREQEQGMPIIVTRPEERAMFAAEPWELEGDFTIPCMFTCSGVILDNGSLLMGYGAADQKIGIAELNFNALIEYLRDLDS